MSGLLSSECPNCGRLHHGYDFGIDPGPVQRERDGWRSLALDMGEEVAAVSAYLRAVAHDGLHRGTDLEQRYVEWANNLDALLARLDQLGKEQT